MAHILRGFGGPNAGTYLMGEGGQLSKLSPQPIITVPIGLPISVGICSCCGIIMGNTATELCGDCSREIHTDHLD